MDTNETITKALKALGLNDNAINAYITSFKYGKLSIGQLAKNADIDRSSCYLACDQLKKNGLLEEEGVAKKIVWVKPPKEIINRLKIEQRKIRTQIDNIDESLPILNAEYSNKIDQPVIQFFSGRDGLRQIVENILDSNNDEILLFTNPEDEKTVFTKQDHEAFISERLKKQISIKVLATKGTLSENLKKSDGSSLRTTKVIDGSLNIRNEMYIFGDNVAMLGYNGQIHGFIIKSKDYTNLQRFLFKKIWNLYE